jgi:hypothetical protein
MSMSMSMSMSMCPFVLDVKATGIIEHMPYMCGIIVEN